jgi:hypothetical protein
VKIRKIVAEVVGYTTPIHLGYGSKKFVKRQVRSLS